MVTDKQRAIARRLSLELLAAAGFASVLAGVWQIHHPSALILGGAGLMAEAVLRARAG